MTQAGLAKVEEARANGQWRKATVREDITVVPVALAEALARNEQARRNFENLAPCYRKQFIYWVSMAKQDATREKRVAETVELLARNRKLGLK